MKKSKTEIQQQAWEELPPHLNDLGFELVEVLFVQEGGRRTLRVFIDKEGGVTLDDCAEVSQVLDPVLDMANFIDGSYYLEVSSPGLERPVRKAVDFQRFAGETVRLRMVEPVEGRKNFKGELKGFEDGLIQVECSGTLHELHIENLDRANLVR
jgi:ribosome maturation factor RimP